MKLKSLWIKDYKNLKDFRLDFEKGNGLSILIGNNGSGKSNVLEAISGIFAEIYGDTIYIFNTDYELEYEAKSYEAGKREFVEIVRELGIVYKKSQPRKLQKLLTPRSGVF